MNLYKFSFIALALTAGFSSCIKDKITTTYTYYEPIYDSKSVVLQKIKTEAPQALQQTGKIFLYGNYIFINEVNKGVHIIDNTNPAAPINKYFISIPGNVDIAVKNNILYADIFTDLLTIDISNITTVQLKKVTYGVFPERTNSVGYIYDTSKYIVGWTAHKETSKDETSILDFAMKNIGAVQFQSAGGAASSAAITTAIGGSMARFTTINNYLYTVGRYSLHTFNITQPENPILTNTKSIGWNIETIYPFNDKLFIGGQNGMYIYSIANPASPTSFGDFNHACFNDPVISDGQYAFVTLRAVGIGNNTCRRGGGQTNQLDVVNVQNLPATSLVKTYMMEQPQGLSKDGNTLFICDGRGGLKYFNASDVTNISLINKITNITPFDVITYNNTAIVVAQEGLFQYNYSNINNVQLLSKITIEK